MQRESTINRHRQRQTGRESRGGFTLVELLVLITVIVTVTAILIPSVKFLLKDRKIREATRVLDAFVVESQTQSLNGGFGGIWIERDTKSPNTSTRVYRVKSPPPYTGDFLGATCRIEQAGPNNLELLNGIDDDGNNRVDDRFVGLVSFPLNTAANAINLISPGDLIQFDLKGAWFVIESVPSQGGGNFPNYTSPIRVSSASGPIPFVAGGGSYVDVPFKVLRMPTRQSGSYVDMPKTTMIDLSKSGLTVMDINGNGLFDDVYPNGRPVGAEFAYSSTDSIRIIFGEDGAMQTVIVNGNAFTPDRSVHLLLATDERETTTDADPANSIDTLLDGSNFWLTITRQGTVSTSQVSTITPGPLPGAMLRQSRNQARQVETAGGG